MMRVRASALAALLGLVIGCDSDNDLPKPPPAADAAPGADAAAATDAQGATADGRAAETAADAAPTPGDAGADLGADAAGPGAPDAALDAAPAPDAAASDAGAADAAPAFAPGACPFTVPAGYTITCGVVTVPENRALPAGRVVRLAVAVVKSRDPVATNLPVVYLEGGPGGSGLSTVVSSLAAGGGTFEALVADRDLITFDQRGTGASVPSLDCPERNGLPGPMEEVRGMMGGLTAEERKELAACRDRLRGQGIDLGQYTSATNADDVDEVRRTLGITRWDLLGVSYGTRLALEVVRRHPAGVRAQVIDSVLPPEVDAAADTPVNIYRALKLVFDRCAAQPTCQARYPDLPGVLAKTLADLTATPATLTLAGGTPVRLDGELAMQFLALLLYRPDGVSVMPELIFQLRDKNYPMLSAYLGAVVDLTGDIADGMYLSVVCADDAPFTTRGAIDAAAASIPADLRRYLRSADPLEACMLWNVPASPATANQAVASPLPTLVLSGEIDPVTPPAYARGAAASLPAAFLFELVGLSHAVFGDPCARALIRDFLAHPETRPAEACVAALQPRPFLVLR
jgi:pimeloyl-ACP methyl ester carboxylesterase